MTDQTEETTTAVSRDAAPSYPTENNDGEPQSQQSSPSESSSSSSESSSESQQPQPSLEPQQSSSSSSPPSQTQEEEEEPKKDYASLLVTAQSLKVEGNTLFASGQFSSAISQYSSAITLMSGGYSQFPTECSIFYGNRAACYVALGHHDQVIKDCSESIGLSPEYSKALLRRAAAYEATNQLSKALADFDTLHKIDPTLKVAIEAKERLPPLVKIQQEKEAAEMIGKLKDLGNSILGKFGLSTDNFQFTKDPASGGYSMNMKK